MNDEPNPLAAQWESALAAFLSVRAIPFDSYKKPVPEDVGLAYSLLNYQAIDDAGKAQRTANREAARELMKVPAPDFEALAVKQDIAFSHLDVATDAESRKAIADDMRRLFDVNFARAWREVDIGG